MSALLTGVFLGLAWLYPGLHASAVLGWLASCGLIICAKSKRPQLNCYLAGLTALPIGFYWIIGTVQEFGGFNLVPALLVFILFVTGSAVQFLIFGYLYKKTNPILGRFALTSAFCWAASELLWIRIFPWEPAHTQLGFTSLVQISDIGGSTLVSFLLFWFFEAAIIVQISKKPKILIAPAIISLIAIFYGFYRINWYQNLELPTQPVALIQANISVEEKHSIKLFRQNTQSYIKLTEDLLPSQPPETLVIWPETVIQDWVYDQVGHINETAYLPHLKNKAALLTGSLTFDGDVTSSLADPDKYQRFNSAVAIYSDGSVPIPYHKNILLPFGEYMPGAKWFPWIQDLNPLAGGFTAGKEIKVFHYPFSNKIVRVSPLICYEDVVPEPALKSTLKGAQILVNLTNDAWFGDSVAPLQHHLIASFRAIENRRFLLRSTNSGLTAIVNPLGQTIAQLPVFSEGSISAEALLLDESTIYTNWGGNRLRFGLLLLTLSILVLAYRRK